MPLLVLLFLVAACQPEARVDPLVDWPAADRVRGALGCTFLGMLCAAALSLLTVRGAYAGPERRPATVRRYYAARWALFFVNVGAAVVAVVAFGWGKLVEEHFRVAWRDGSVLAPFAELLVPAPYLANVVANWFLYYPAERALARTSSQAGRRAAWSLPAFVLFNARMFGMTVALPVSLCTLVTSLVRFAPEWQAEGWYQLGMMAGAAAFLVLLPRLVKPVLGFKTLPAGPHRDRLDALGRRLGFRRTDLLLWPTRGGAANAMIFGVVPQARYVVFTDSILDTLTPPELDAVFGHEVGHARHGHLAYYLLFLLLSAVALAAAGLALREFAAGRGWLELLPAWADPGFRLGSILAMGVYLFVVFGWLSRVCERQADVAGARAASCGRPRCDGHEDESLAPLANGGSGEPLCETGVRAMIMALEAVMGLNGLTGARRSAAGRALAWFRSWQHGPPDTRIGFLHALADRPELAAAHDRYAYRVRWGIALALAAVTAAAGSYVGWGEVWKAL